MSQIEGIRAIAANSQGCVAFWFSVPRRMGLFGRGLEEKNGAGGGSCDHKGTYRHEA